MRFITNKEIAKLLRSISAAYSATGRDRFKIIAYDNAADSVEHTTSELKDLWEENKLDSVPGLGKNIQSHLDELFKTGKVKHFNEVMKNLPSGMFELLNIGGLGPKSAYKLASVLKVKNVKELEDAAKKGKIRNLAGFGPKSEVAILSAIEELNSKPQTRFTLPFAYGVADTVLGYLRRHKDCDRAEPLGSLRRMVATVGDIDIAVASENPKGIIEHFKKFPQIKRVLDAGERKSSVLLFNGMQVDLLVQPTHVFGALLQHFTGSKNHNVHLREIALKNKMSVSDYGITIKGKLNEYENEHQFYKALGMDYIEPELREDTGEIEAALKNNLPSLVKIEDIKGDIHLHSSYQIEPSHDLGTGSFEEIIKKGKELNYEYIGLSDHSPGAGTHTKKQIIGLIKKRTDRIEQIKSSVKNIRILNLLEIDILSNGELSVPDDGLKLLDGSIAGIHSSHSQSKELITKRILKACHSPYVNVISHPTNRLLLQRESSDANWPEVFKACVKTNTMLEINAWPNRLDLPDSLVKQAIAAGVKLIINSDSHDISQMDNMKYGVSVARRGWAQPKNIANTLPWVEFKKMFRV